jgi:hypothetical protein
MKADKRRIIHAKIDNLMQQAVGLADETTNP